MNDEQAAELVQVRTHELGGPWFIELVGALDKPVAFGPYDNPSTAHDEAKSLRRYLAALLAQQASPV